MTLLHNLIAKMASNRTSHQSKWTSTGGYGEGRRITSQIVEKGVQGIYFSIWIPRVPTKASFLTWTRAHEAILTAENFRGGG